MAVSVFDFPRGRGSRLAATRCLFQTTVGLLRHALLGFGRPAVIERATGRVRTR